MTDLAELIAPIKRVPMGLIKRAIFCCRWKLALTAYWLFLRLMPRTRQADMIIAAHANIWKAVK